MALMTRLIIISLASGPLFLLAFKKLSNQDKIRTHKNQMVGYLLEIRLYKDYLIRTLIAMSGIFKHYLLYLRYLLTPMLILSLPLLFICLQIESRFGHSPLGKNDEFIIRAELDGAHSKQPDLFQVRCKTSSNIKVQTHPLRVIEDQSVYWRAKVTNLDNSSSVQIIADLPSGREKVDKRVVTGESTGQAVFDHLRKVKTFRDIFFFNESVIPDNSVFRSVTIGYPSTYLPFIFWKCSPITIYLALTIIFGFLVKPFISVKI